MISALFYKDQLFVLKIEVIYHRVLTNAAAGRLLLSLWNLIALPDSLIYFYFCVPTWILGAFCPLMLQKKELRHQLHDNLTRSVGTGNETAVVVSHL